MQQQSFDGSSRDWGTRDEIQSLRSMYTKLLRPQNLDPDNGNAITSNYVGEKTPFTESKSSAQDNTLPKQSMKLKMRLDSQRKNDAQSNEDLKRLFVTPGSISTFNGPATNPGLSKEISVLLQEKKYWLSRIQEDNFNLLSLLKNVQGAKERLMKHINELELERDKLRSLLSVISIPGIQSLFDSLNNGNVIVDETFLPPMLSVPLMRLKAHSLELFGEESISLDRQNFDVPPHREDQIRVELFRLLLRCLSNQFELLLNLQKRADRIAQLVVDGRQNTESAREVEAELESLRGIAEVAPHNSQTADSLSESNLFKAIVSGLVSKAANAAGREMIKSAAQFPSRSQGRQASSTASSSSINASQQMSAGASGNSEVAAEMQALIAQNEELKASLLQMRKRNAQLRTNMAAGLIPSTPGGPNRRNSGESVPATVPLSKRSPSEERPDPNTAHGSKDQWTEEEFNPESKKVATSGSPIDVPASGLGSGLPTGGVLSDFFDSQLKKYCQSALEDHPLAVGIREGVLSAMAGPSATALRPTAAPVFVAQLQQRLMESYGGAGSGSGFGAGSKPRKGQLLNVQLSGGSAEGSVEDGVGWQHAFNRFARFEEADEDLRTAALAAMEQCMRTPLVQVELSAVLSLFLTYLHVSRGIQAPLPQPEEVHDQPPAASTEPQPQPQAQAHSSLVSSLGVSASASVSVSQSPAQNKTRQDKKKSTATPSLAAATSESSQVDSVRTVEVPVGGEGVPGSKAKKTKNKATKKSSGDSAEANPPPPPPPSSAPTSASAPTVSSSQPPVNTHQAGAGIPDSGNSETKQLQDIFKIPKTKKKNASSAIDS